MTTPISAGRPGHASRQALAVPPELLTPSSTAHLLRMALEEWIMIAMIGGGLSLMPWWLYPAALILLAGRYHALGVILHDAAHTVARFRVTRHGLLELLCGLPIGTTLPAMRYHHLRHHRENGSHADPYAKHGEQTWVWWTLNTARGVLLYPFWVLRAPVGVLAAAVPSMRRFYARVFLQDRTDRDFRESREVRACAIAEERQLAWQLAILPAYVLWPLAMVAIHLLPVVVAGLLSAHRLLIEHRYDDAGDHAGAHSVLSSTRDNYLGWLGAIALAPRNVGYHVVHHLHPRASLSALPRLRDWYRTHHPDVYS